MTATFRVTVGSLKCQSNRGTKTIDLSCLEDFWRSVGSGSQQGVYVFGVKAAKGFKPLYVGQTKKQSFRKRIDQHIKYGGKFDRTLKGIGKGTPVLFFIGRIGSGNKSNSAIDELEIEIINYAFSKNKNLHNDRGIKTPKYIVLGFQGPGKPPRAALELRKMIGYR